MPPPPTRPAVAAAVLVGSMLPVACSDASDSDFDSGRACQLGHRLVIAVVDGDHGDVAREIENLAELQGIADADLDADAIESLTDGDLDQGVADDVIVEFQSVDECEIEVDA